MAGLYAGGVETRTFISPKILEQRGLIFWFHSYDALHENRAGVHVGKSSQDDFNDAKIWLEPEITVARRGRTLREHELNLALKIIEKNQDYLMEQWYGYTGKSS